VWLYGADILPVIHGLEAHATLHDCVLSFSLSCTKGFHEGLSQYGSGGDLISLESLLSRSTFLPRCWSRVVPSP